MLNAEIVVLSARHSPDELTDRLGSPTRCHAKGDQRRGTVYDCTRWGVDVPAGPEAIEERLARQLMRLGPSALRGLQRDGATIRVELWASLESSYDWPGLSFTSLLLKLLVDCEAEIDLDIAVV